MRGAIQLSLRRSQFTNPPIRPHRLAAIKAAIFFRSPIALITPCLEVGLRALWQIDAPGRLERGAGLIEGAGGVAALVAGIAVRIEPAQPLPGFGRTRIANALGNRADMNVAIVDKPAMGAVRVWAAGKIRHRRI